MLMRNEMMQIQRLQVIGELAASVSHEVRNPLTVSRGFLQLLLERHKDNEQDARYLRLTLEEMDRAQHIITDYLAYAKPEAEMVSRLQVADELAYVISVLEPYALLGKVEIKVSGVGEGFVLGDKHKFRQCLINLLKNGIERCRVAERLRSKLCATARKRASASSIAEPGCRRRKWNGWARRIIQRKPREPDSARWSPSASPRR